MFYFSLILSFVFSTSFQPDKDNFDWLVGTWAGVDNTEINQTFEVWEKLGEGMYKGLGYSLKSGDTTFVEKLAIANIYGVLHYTADVSGNDGPVHFEMIKLQEMGFVCGNSQNDFPKLIEYRFDGATLTATISGEGKSRSFIFRRI